MTEYCCKFCGQSIPVEQTIYAYGEYFCSQRHIGMQRDKDQKNNFDERFKPKGKEGS